MRILLTLYLLVFISCGGNKKVATATASPQVKYEAEIREKLNLYNQKMAEGDYIASLDFVYPKLFEIVPKETMVGLFKQTFDSEDMKITISDSKVLKVHDNYIEADNNIYTLVDYSFDMNMKLTGEMVDAGEFMIGLFETEYGKENVIYDKEKNTFNIKTENQMIVIKENGEWYFLENKKEPAYQYILERLVGEDILKKLGVKKT